MNKHLELFLNSQLMCKGFHSTENAVSVFLNKKARGKGGRRGRVTQESYPKTVQINN